jgi:hypothetical protein
MRAPAHHSTASGGTAPRSTSAARTRASSSGSSACEGSRMLGALAAGGGSATARTISNATRRISASLSLRFVRLRAMRCRDGMWEAPHEWGYVRFRTRLRARRYFPEGNTAGFRAPRPLCICTARAKAVSPSLPPRMESSAAAWSLCRLPRRFLPLPPDQCAQRTVLQPPALARSAPSRPIVRLRGGSRSPPRIRLVKGEHRTQRVRTGSMRCRRIVVMTRRHA